MIDMVDINKIKRWALVQQRYKRIINLFSIATLLEIENFEKLSKDIKIIFVHYCYQPFPFQFCMYKICDKDEIFKDFKEAFNAAVKLSTMICEHKKITSECDICIQNMNEYLTSTFHHIKEHILLEIDKGFSEHEDIDKLTNIIINTTKLMVYFSNLNVLHKNLLIKYIETYYLLRLERKLHKKIKESEINFRQKYDNVNISHQYNIVNYGNTVNRTETLV